MPRALPYVLIIAIAAIPFALSNEGIIDSVDAAFPLHPIETLISKQWMWDSTWAFGGNASLSNPNTIPYHVILALASLIFNVELLSKVWYVAIFAMGGCAIYWFTTSFLKSDYKSVGGFMAAIFFMFNPVQVQALVHGISIFHYTWYALPLVLALFIKTLSVGRQKFIVYAVVFSLAYTVLQASTDIQNRIIITMPYLLFFAYQLVKNKSRKEVVIRFLVCLAILFLFNLFWIAPGMVSIAEVYEIQSSEQQIYRSLEGAGETFLNIIRLSVAPSFDLYNQTWLVEIGLVIFIAAMIGLLQSIRMLGAGSIAVYLGISFFFFAILTRGTESPFGEIYKVIFNAPYGDILLTNAPPKYIYLLLVPMSFFVGTFVAFFLSSINKIINKGRLRFATRVGSCIAIFILIISVAFPMFIHPDLGGFGNFSYLRSVRIPEYYSQAHNWLNSDDSSFRVFAVPSPAWRGYSHYNWSPYDMAEILPEALRKPIVTNFPTVSEINTKGQLPIIRTIADSLDTEPSEVILNALSRMNVKYILVRTDLAAGAMGHQHINNFPTLDLDRAEFGALSFYEVPNSGRVYFPDKMVVLIGNTTHMMHANAFPYLRSASYYVVDNSEIKFIPSTIWENADAIIDSSSGNRLEMLDNNTLSITITASGNGGDIPYNIHDITKGAIVISTGTGRNLGPYESITNKFTLDYLNSVGQVQIDEGDEIVITGIGNGYSSNTITVGSSHNFLPEEAQQLIQDANLKVGFIISANTRQIYVPAEGYFEVTGAGDDKSLLALSLTSGNKLEISRDGSSQVLLDRGTYVISNVSGLNPPFFIRISPQSGESSWTDAQENNGLSFVENSPTSISIHNTSKAPYIGVLTDGNSALWKTNSKVIRFIADGYSNGFIVPDGSDINIEFEPQNYFWLGSTISIISVVSLTGWSLHSMKKWKKDSPNANVSRVLLLYHVGDNFGPPVALDRYLQEKIDDYVSVRFPLGFAKRQTFEIESYHKGKSEFRVIKDMNRAQDVWWHGDTVNDMLAEIGYHIKAFFMILKLTNFGMRKFDLGIGVDPICAFHVILLRELGVVNQTIYSNYNDVTPLRSKRRFFNWIYNVVIRYSLNNSDYVWYRWKGHRDEVLRRFEKVKEKRVIFVPHGSYALDNGAAGVVRNRKRIISAKSVSETAGLQLLIEAMPELLSVIPDLEFIVVGVGKYLPTLQEMAKKRGLEKHVLFLGQKSHEEVMQIISSSAIGYSVYLPTELRKTMETDTTINSIGATTSTMEMLGAGLPIIATRGMGISFDLEKYDAGIVIDWDREQLCKALLKLLSDPQLYETFSKNAFELSQKYEWTNIFNSALSGNSITIGPQE